ncbi:uncharacterized protein LOC142558264 [Dermacentor variabilis]|uniref:uncharacterized protein LOC142558264 n=1 Tax=Dermacentor variabilis TaxID=34621 RepID=UPI003F5CA86B
MENKPTCSKKDGACVKQGTPRIEDKLLSAITRPLCGLWLQLYEPVPSTSQPSQLTHFHDPVSTAPPVVVQEFAPTTSWPSSQKLPSTPTGRGRSQIRMAFTPRTSGCRSI